MHLTVELLHTMIQNLRSSSSFCQFFDNMVRDFPVILIENLVFQRGPEIHGNSSDLNLNRHSHRTSGEEDRDLNYRVQTLVPIGLRVRDIVLELKDRNIVLSA